jgi:hypothetical protein
LKGTGDLKILIPTKKIDLGFQKYIDGKY